MNSPSKIHLLAEQNRKGREHQSGNALLRCIFLLIVVAVPYPSGAVTNGESKDLSALPAGNVQPEGWDDESKPSDDASIKGDRHLGVASCAGSNCHGATRPYLTSSVEQNEYIVWNREDPHSRAYLVLLNERSKRIAHNLGLSEPAHESKVCLDCHADNVPADLRGKRFDLSDGVGCEACHGGGSRYLGPHVSGEGTHADNVRHGLYPTENPQKRAELCNRCHVGDDQRFASHRIMGAGHPRISFELDTYSEVHKHYVADKDYSKRKNVGTHAGVWAFGQVDTSIRFLELFIHGKHQHSGLMPELSFFDCQSCHHDVEMPSDAFAQGRSQEDSGSSKLTWEKRGISGMGPGLIRFNDSGLIMASIVADVVEPAEGAHLRQQIGELHKASQSDANKMHQVGEALLKSLKDLEAIVAKHDFTAGDCGLVLNALVERSRQNDYLSYAAAEQVVMAVEAIRATLSQNGDNRLTDATMNGLRAATSSPASYRPAVFRQALQSISTNRSH